MSLTLGYKASAEQFGPRELLEYSVLAEQLGLDSIAVSDHFQPWRHHGGHSPNALVWLGAHHEAAGLEVRFDVIAVRSGRIEQVPGAF